MKALLVLATLLLLVAAGTGFVLLRESERSTAVALERVEALSLRVEDLRAQLAAREAGQLGAEERAAILRLIAENRLEQERSEDASRKERFRAFSAATAIRVGKEHGLTEEQRSELAEVLFQGFDKLVAMEASVRERMLAGDDIDALVEGARTASRDLEAWRSAELAKRLGPSIAARLEKDDELRIFADAGRFEASRKPR